MISAVDRRRSTALFFVATSLFWASMYLYVPILPVHAGNLGASMGLVGTIVGAYGFSQLLLRIPIGVWSDRIGLRKPFILAGLLAAGLGALGLGLSSDPVWLVVWRGVAGAGASAWVVFTVFFSGYYLPERATQAMSYVTFVSGAAQLISTYAGGVIAQTWGWYAPFHVAVVLALLGTAAAVPLTEKPLLVTRKMTFKQFFRIGTVPLLVAVSVATMLGQWTSWVTSSGFTLVFAAQLGAGPADLGMLTSLTQLAYTLSVLPSDYLALRWGVRAIATAGLGIQAAGAFVVPLVDSLSLVAVSQALAGIGRGLSYPLLMGLAIRSVGAGDRATAMGVFQAVYALGMFAGPASTGVLGDALGLSSVFLVAGAASLVGAAITASAPSKGA